ncbi:MAG: HEAT repeat domain-containing protein [Planctomycetota bacterium]|jgi:hypothetical protein
MRTLLIALMVLGLMGIAPVGVTSPVSPLDKVVIGILDFETIGPAVESLEEKKKTLMKELRRNARVKLVDIHESCGLSDLKRNGYEQAERYKINYQLDMILHSHIAFPAYNEKDRHAYFSLIDLYTNKVKEVSIETVGIPIELGFRGISKKLLISKDLNRVLKAKKEKVLGVKKVAVPREVGESPEEIEGFLIQYGPRLIAEDQYNRVLELIEDLPGRRRRHIQIRTLECFANLKGWVCDKDKYCKLSWGKLRNKLIDSGDNEATPILVILLEDEEPYVRLYVAELLGHIGDKRALQDLRAVGEGDENRKVRKYAKKAYEQISGEKF